MGTLVVLLASLACMCAALYLSTKEEGTNREMLIRLFFVSVIFIGIIAVAVKSGVITNETLISLFGMYKEVTK